TALVKNYDWRQYSVKLEPDADYTHIILEVFYPPQSLFPENGNIILDNAQPLVPMECEADPYDLPDPVSEEAITLVNPETEIQTNPVEGRTGKGPTNPPVPEPEPAAPVVKLGATEATIREGQVFAVENIRFKADSPELESASESALNEIVGFLRENANLVVEIGGHASQRADATYATQLSQNRAISVVNYLKDQRIGYERLWPRGYGKTRPVCMQDDPDCRKRNQRVEVKILKIKQSR
ncbi:MAG: OmpA family protein, partial [Bacteroidota bacterium]